MAYLQISSPSLTSLQDEVFGLRTSSRLPKRNRWELYSVMLRACRLRNSAAGAGSNLNERGLSPSQQLQMSPVVARYARNSAPSSGNMARLIPETADIGGRGTPRPGSSD